MKPYFCLALLLLAVLITSVSISPKSAHAQAVEHSVTHPNETVEGNGMLYGNALGNRMGCASVSIVGNLKISGVIVDCIRNALLVGTGNVFVEMRRYYNFMLMPLLSLALCLLAIDLMLNPNMTKSLFFLPRVMIFILKIALVLYLTQQIGDTSNPTDTMSLPHRITGAINDLAAVVTEPITASATSVLPADVACPNDNTMPVVVETSPGVFTTVTNVNNSYIIWNRMDCIIGRLLGIGAGLSIKLGILGLIGAALFSGSMGVAVFFAGLTALLMLASAFIRAIYTVVSSYVLICFLLVLGPFFISMIMFKATYSMFEKWLDLLVGSILQPILAFAFLAMFLVLIQIAIYGTHNDLAAGEYGKSIDGLPTIASALETDFKTQWKFIDTYKKDRPLFSWRIPADPAFYERVGAHAALASMIAVAATGLNSLMESTGDLNFLYLPFIDWGAGTANKFVELFIAFVVLIILCDLMLSFLRKIPEISMAMMSARSSVNPVMGYFPGEASMHGAVAGAHEAAADAVAGGRGLFTGGGLKGALTAGGIVTRGIPAAAKGAASGGLRAAIRGTPHG